jgi:CspA family cold shock protein
VSAPGEDLGPGQRFGIVVGFDSTVGLGQVQSDDGSTHDFHCTQIADGSRSIAVGTAVSFEIVAAQLGRWQAARLQAAVRVPTPTAQARRSWQQAVLPAAGLGSRRS